MLGLVIAILVAGLLALGASAALLAAFRFERFVGLRYLQRARSSRTVRLCLVGSTALTLVGLALFLVGRDRLRELETAGVVLALVGALLALLFLLLRVFSVFTTVSTMGVILGVASLVVVLAVTSGFEREFQDKVLAVNAHLIVTEYGRRPSMEEAEREADRARKKLGGLAGLQRISKFSFSSGEVMVGKVGANLKGVDLADGAPELTRARIAGEIAALGRPAAPCPGLEAPGPGGEPGRPGRIVLGAELARKLRKKVGDCVLVLVPFSGEPEKPPTSFPFAVVGIFQMGFHEYDARLAFVGLEDARRLGDARESVFGLELRFRDPVEAMRMQPEVERRLGNDWRTIDWRTLNNNLFMALTMQKVIIALLLVLIIVVAAFNIVASLTMIVLSKVREIAILSSMGARSRSILRIFLVAGSFAGFAGTGLGILYGLAVCGLATLYGYPLDPKVYLIERLPVEISGRELLFVAAATQLICFAATLYPALRAGRLRVVEGLRYN